MRWLGWLKESGRVWVWFLLSPVLLVLVYLIVLSLLMVDGFGE